MCLCYVSSLFPVKLTFKHLAATTDLAKCQFCVEVGGRGLVGPIFLHLLTFAICCRFLGRYRCLVMHKGDNYIYLIIYAFSVFSSYCCCCCCRCCFRYCPCFLFLEISVVLFRTMTFSQHFAWSFFNVRVEMCTCICMCVWVYLICTWHGISPLFWIDIYIE